MAAPVRLMPQQSPAISAERTKLADVIADGAAIERELAELREADGRVGWDRSVQAEARVEAAQAAIEQSRADRARDLVAGTKTARSLADVRAELESAEDEVATLRAAREEIRERRDALRIRQDRQPDRLRDAARAVMRAELVDAPAVARLIDDLRQARAKVLRLGVQVRWLAEQGIIPLSQNDNLALTVVYPPSNWTGDAAVPDERWANALAALMQNADGPLPAA
jgi:chromosome segregation ATPase